MGRLAIPVLGTLTLATILVLPAQTGLAQAPTAKRILIVAGPSAHPPGTHEVDANARLLAYCLEHAQGIGPVRAEVRNDWPTDSLQLDQVDAVVFCGDIFPPEIMPEPETIKADLARMMARGCGLACLHYATGLRNEHVAPGGDHPLLAWMGGYFATGCDHHKSVARMMTATIEPAAPGHPVMRGWKAVTIDDEPYYNNYFGPDGMKPNVTALVTAMLPPEDPKREVIGWSVERPDGGRGIGIVMPHFFKNWANPDVRTLLLNSVAWAARIEIPEAGVRCELPDLGLFEPGSVEPQPRARPAAKKAGE